MAQNRRKSKSRASVKRKVISTIIALVLAIIAFFVYEFILKPKDENHNVPEGTCEFHMIDVGQGDATLIRVGNKNILIDTSESGEREKLVNYLEKQGVTELEYFVATHPDSDHIGSADYIINNYTVHNVILSPKEHTTKTYERMIEAIEAKVDSGEIKDVINPQDMLGESIMVGDLELKMLGPIGEFSKNDNNNPSVVIMARWGNKRVLLTGDAETEAEERLIEEYGSELKCDVLKVGHHGSDSSTWKSGMLQYTKPTYATISCGVGNSYNHPHKEPLDALAQSNVEVYRTDLQGTILISINNDVIEITTEK